MVFTRRNKTKTGFQNGPAGVRINGREIYAATSFEKIIYNKKMVCLFFYLNHREREKKMRLRHLDTTSTPADRVREKFGDGNRRKFGR
jgi:hypothetical protein